MNRLFIALFLCITFSTFSQVNQQQKGDILKDRLFLIDKSEISAVDDSGNFISIRPHRINGTLRNYYVEFYNDLNFDGRIEIETQNSTSIIDVFIINKKAHIFIKELNKNQISLRFDLIDLNSKSYSYKTLLTVDKKEQPEVFKSLKNKGNLSLDFSSNILLSFTVIEDNALYTFIKYFDRNLNELSLEKVFPNKPINKKYITFLNASQNNGLIYLLFSVNDKSDNKYFQLIEINKNNKRELTIPIKHDFYELINSTIHNNNYIISGLLSKKKKGGYEGYTYYNIDLDTFETNSTKQTPFLTQKVKKYFRGFFKSGRDIDIRKIFIDKDHNTYIVGQFYKVEKEYVPIGMPIGFVAIGGVVVYMSYNPIKVEYKTYDDILISKIDSRGKLIWDKILDLKRTIKIKSNSNKRDSSYHTFFENDHVNILMNGYINTELDNLVVKQDKRKRKTNFYNITVNSNGEITPNILFPNSNSEIIFRAEKSIVINKDIFILGQGNMRKQLIKIKL